MEEYLNIMSEYEFILNSIPKNEYFYAGQRIMINIYDYTLTDNLVKDLNKFVLENQLILIDVLEGLIIVEFTTTMRS